MASYMRPMSAVLKAARAADGNKSSRRPRALDACPPALVAECIELAVIIEQTGIIHTIH
jgi:hypothetical protein